MWYGWLDNHCHNGRLERFVSDNGVETIFMINDDSRYIAHTSTSNHDEMYS